MTQRPVVVCHMLTSLNGKIDGVYFENPAAGPGLDCFGKIRNSYHCDAVIFGAATMEAFCEGKLNETALADKKDLPKKDWVSPEAADNEGFQVVLDPLGSLAYHRSFLQRGTGPRQHIIEVVSEKVPGAYLSYLQEVGVSSIVAGKDSLKGAVILQKLADLFGISRIALSGGGLTNGTFLREGLIDELSLVIVPVAEMEKGATSFEAMDGAPLLKNSAFTLKGVEVLAKDALWIRYERVKG
jgi:riboflavin biosynthesis pyrimidine reductase